MVQLGPKMLNTANGRLDWVTTIADPANPKATELNAGVNLTCRVTVANYQFGITGNETITDAARCDDIEAGVPGRATVEAGFDMFRFKETADDIAFTTFTGKNLPGYLVERIGQVEDGERPEDMPYKAGDVVQILDALTFDPVPQSPSTAGYEKFRQTFAPQRHWPRAVVAAP